MARPSIYSDEIAEEICGLLIEGKSLHQICRRRGMPDRRTVHRWQESKPDFAARCARAREAQADYMDDLILETAVASKAETAAADRVKISAFQWRAAKLAPKRYGDRIRAEITGKNGGPIQTFDLGNLSVDELERLDSILARVAQQGGGAGGTAEEEGEGGA